MNIVRLWIPVCLAGIVVGCGQKGPLVLPDAPKHKKAVPSLRAPAAAPPAVGAPAGGGAAASPAPATGTATGSAPAAPAAPAPAGTVAPADTPPTGVTANPSDATSKP